MASSGLAAYKKNAVKSGKSVLFLDETGLMLQPLVRRTWARVANAR